MLVKKQSLIVYTVIIVKSYFTSRANIIMHARENIYFCADEGEEEWFD